MLWLVLGINVAVYLWLAATLWKLEAHPLVVGALVLWSLASALLWVRGGTL